MSKELNLDEAADSFDIPAGDVDAVVSRGRTRTQRRRAVLATVTTIAVVTGAASFIGTRGTDGDGDNTNIAAGISGDAKPGDDQFTWTRTESAKGLAWAPAVSGSGQLYALSTGPGERMSENVRQNGQLYRSTDGVDWQSVSRLGNDMFLSDLAPSSERLYAVGTGPATAVAGRTSKSSELLAGWSDDGGETWSKAALPFDMRAVAAKSLNSSVADTEVAASPKGTVAVAVVRAALDVPALLPAGAAAPNGWATTASGVDLLGPKKSQSVCPAGTSAQKGEPDSVEAGEVGPTYCYSDETSPGQAVVSPQDARGVTASYTWDQLGVSGDVLRAARGELLAFFAEPGSTDFVRVDAGSEPVGAPLLAIAAEDGFDIVKSSSPKPMGPGSMSVLHSTDGRSWAPAPSDSKMSFASSAGLLGATPVVFGGNEQGAPVMMRRTAAGWVSTDLSPLVARPADTEVFVGMAGVGPAGAALSVSITKEGGEQRGVPVNRLLTTRDGVTWHDQSVDELAGRKVGGVGMVVVTGERIVVSAYLPKTDANAETAPRLTLIGTPR